MKRTFTGQPKTAVLWGALLATCLITPAPLPAATPIQIIWQQAAHEGGAYSVDFSPDGQRVVSGGAYIVQSGAQLFYGENKLWAARDGRLLALTSRDQSLGATNEIVFLPDGKTIATANGAVYCTPENGCGSVAPGLAKYSARQLGRLALLGTNPINATIDDFAGRFSPRHRGIFWRLSRPHS